MAKSNPTRPDPPDSEARLHDRNPVPDAAGPPLKDPRAVSAMDNIGVDDQADLLDAELDDQPGDDLGRRSFTDDVRSDRYDDERRERR